MTKKTYEAVAAAFRAQGRHITRTSELALLLGLAVALADIFKADNPAFNRTKFLKACGGSQ